MFTFVHSKGNKENFHDLDFVLDIKKPKKQKKKKKKKKKTLDNKPTRVSILVYEKLDCGNEILCLWKLLLTVIKQKLTNIFCTRRRLHWIRPKRVNFEINNLLCTG